MHEITAQAVALSRPLHPPHMRNGHPTFAAPRPALGGGGQLFWFEDPDDRNATRIVRLAGAELVELPVFHAPMLALVHGDGRPRALATDGREFEFDGSAWIQTADGPPGLAGWREALCGLEPSSGRVVVVAGISQRLEPVDEVYCLQDHAWSTWTPKGRTPRVEYGAIGWSASRGCFVVMGRAGRTQQHCWEIREGAIEKFEHAGPRPGATLGGVGEALLAWERAPKSTINAFEAWLWRYDGGGRWTQVATIRGDGNLLSTASMQFDRARGAIVGVGVALRTREYSGTPGLGWHGVEIPIDRDVIGVASASVDAPGEIEAPRQPQSVARIERSGGEAGEDRIAPTGLAEVRCSCGGAMTPLLLLAGERLGLRSHRALSVQACFRCDGSFAAFGGANAVQLHRETPQVGGDPLGTTPATEPEGGPGLPEPKLGGLPRFFQGDDTPACSECRAPMRFIAQFDELRSGWNFADGMAYVFVCPDEHEGRMLWQC